MKITSVETFAAPIDIARRAYSENKHLRRHQRHWRSVSGGAKSGSGGRDSLISPTG